MCIESPTKDGGWKMEKLTAFGLISAIRAIPVEVTDLTDVKACSAAAQESLAA